MAGGVDTEAASAVTSGWVGDLMDGAFADPSGRIVKVRCDEVTIEGVLVGRVRFTFTVEDLRGDTYEAKGRVLVPASLRDSKEVRLPLVVHCGYEANEEHAVKQVALGRVSATTVQLPLDSVYPNAWSLVRGPKMEIVLAHLVRSLPFVDPAKVVYIGGSAGGYSALLAAAAAFPAAAAVAGVPPVNLAYMGALWQANHARLKGSEEPSVGWLQGVLPAALGWQDAYGEDLDAPGWLGHSPVGHVDRITCPVATFFSMADPLVPIDQVDRGLAAAIIQARPGDLELRAEVLTDAASAQVRLLDVLGDRADVHVAPVPADAAPMAEADLTMLAEMPPFVLSDVEPVAGRWWITVADEGEPVFVVSHFKHQYEPDFDPFVDRALTADLSVEQLTDTKLAQLLDRYAGVEWVAPGFSQLDRPDAERADVELGLRRYCEASPAHRERFAALYGPLAHDPRVLPPELVEELCR
jgi:hypothetical protein